MLIFKVFKGEHAITEFKNKHNSDIIEQIYFQEMYCDWEENKTSFVYCLAVVYEDGK